MSRIVWDAIGEHLYETGVDRAVVYPQATDGTYPQGFAWNGITSVSESPSGAEATDLWADNRKYLSLLSAEDFGASIEAYTYPDEFAVLDGTASPVAGVTIAQQTRRPFGFCYRTVVGNDTASNDHGYKLHLIYGAKASPSEKSYQTINDSPEAISFSWELTTTPVNVTGYKATALVTIDSTKVNDSEKMQLLEDVLYGKDAVAADVDHGIEAQEATDARLPLPDEVIYILQNGTLPA